MRAPERLTTERLTGRRVAREDLSYIVEIDSDIRVQATLFGEVQTPAQSQARIERWIEMWDTDGIGFWVFSDAQGRIVGHGGLFRSPREQGEIEVGYVVKPAFWGHGFATEITRASLRIGFEQLHFERIIAIAQFSNTASRRVLEKCGMTFEAELPSPDGIPGVRYAIERGFTV